MARQDDSAPEEYIRFRSNVQLGDGPDQRGDITVEMRRAVGPLAETSRDRVFADFAQEVGRGEKLLRDKLQIPREDDEAEDPNES